MKQVETEVTINAAPDKVWAALAEGPDWGAWNSFITRVEGELKPGARLKNTLEMVGQKPMTFKPTVLKAEPGVELRWLGRVLMPGLFDGEHYFKLRAVDGGTQLTHGEVFKGILIGMLKMDDVRRSFEVFNRGLKRKVEG